RPLPQNRVVPRTTGITKLRPRNRPAIFVQFLTSIVEFLCRFVAWRAQRLQPSTDERVPVAGVRLDMVGNRGGHDLALVETKPAQRLFLKLGAANPAPTFQSVPAAPIGIEPWRLAPLSGLTRRMPRQAH